jgi:hypothetical protein
MTLIHELSECKIIKRRPVGHFEPGSICHIEIGLKWYIKHGLIKSNLAMFLQNYLRCLPFTKMFEVTQTKSS